MRKVLRFFSPHISSPKQTCICGVLLMVMSSVDWTGLEGSLPSPWGGSSFQALAPLLSFSFWLGAVTLPIGIILMAFGEQQLRPVVIRVLTALLVWHRTRQRLSISALLQCLPPSMRDDAEGLLREFADVRDEDRARGGAPWRTMLKCAWYLTCYVVRTAIALAFAALVGRLLRL